MFDEENTHSVQNNDENYFRLTFESDAARTHSLHNEAQRLGLLRKLESSQC